MIFAKLGKEAQSAVYPPVLRRALAYLRNTDLMKLPLGRHDLDGDRLFLFVMEFEPRDFEGSHPEVHRNYVDLFYWPEGGERIGISSCDEKTELIEVQPEKDIAFLKDAHNESFLTAEAGDFAVFFPWDAHRPSLKIDGETRRSRKCVMKIRLDLFEEN